MALSLKWNKRAKKSFDRILLYLDEEFGQNTKRAFVVKTFTIIERLQEFPDLGSMEIKQKKIRGFLVTKHNRLFYRSTNKELIILNFFDTRQHPKKKKM